MKKFYSQLSLIFAFFYNLLPWSANRFFGWILATLWVDIFRIRRQVILSNLDKAFPEKSIQEKKQIMKQSMIYLCQSFFDVIRIPYLNESQLQNRFVIEGQENLPSEGGVFFMSLHLGSGDLGAAVCSAGIKPISLITKRFKNQFLDTFWFTLRQKSKTEFIDAHAKNNAFEILKALRRGRGVAFVIDQFMGKPYGVATTFFGHETGSPYGLALFAQKTKAPIHPLYTYWDDHGRLHVVAGPRIRIEDHLSPDLEKNNVILTQLFNHVLEDIIRQHPEQWMWVHKRWKVFE